MHKEFRSEKHILNVGKQVVLPNPARDVSGLQVCYKPSSHLNHKYIAKSTFSYF